MRFLSLLRSPRFLAIGVLGLIGLGAIAAYYAAWALAFDFKNVRDMPQTTVIYDRNGAVLQRIYEENRIVVPADHIPRVMREAVVATEDQRFYHHPGIDPLGIIRAAVGDLFHSRIRSGASTITQQLARNSAQMSQRTIDRKLKEIFLAFRIEAAYSKDQILTFYLNRIFFGRHYFGIGAAAEAYFGKDPRDLTLSQAAMLAGIISGPNSFSPWKSPEKARAAKARALTRMEERGYITRAQMEAALAEPLALRPIQDIVGSHAAEEAQEEAGRLLNPAVLTRGGLKIYTTIDLAFQRTAENELERQLSSVEREPGYRHVTRAAYLREEEHEAGSVPYLQGAFVALSNADGGILALVGGRNYDESHFDRATESPRQIGSTMKPFVYANAFNTLNLSALTLVDHSVFDLRHSDQPGAADAGTPDYITVREALERSDNYAAERTAIAGGLESFAYLFQQASGVAVPPFPSSALGACGATPLQLVSAFSVFPDGGMKIEPYLIRRITTADDKVIYEHIDRRRRVLSAPVAFQIVDLLRGVVDHGTGRSVRNEGVTGDIGGKTGTTNDFKDSWFVGFSSQVTAGAWVGFDRPAEVLAGGFASRLAAPFWGRVMRQAGEHYLAQPMPAPPGLFQARGTMTEKSLFGTSVVASGNSEYLRDDQRGGYLARIGDAATASPADANDETAAATDSPTNGLTVHKAARGGGLFGWFRRQFDDDAPAPRPAPAPPAPLPVPVEEDAPRAVPAQ
jgi:penicillin-binding protein 1A